MTPAALLAFEAAHPRHNGSKEEAIRHELGVTPARYYQLLGRAAWQHPEVDPITARRVRERAARAA